MEINKYIIRNCPVCEFSDCEECTGYLAEGYICNDIHTEIVECKERTDCVMKQIVGLCKENLNSLETYVDIRSLECTTLQNILKLLDIQEVE